MKMCLFHGGAGARLVVVEVVLVILEVVVVCVAAAPAAAQQQPSPLQQRIQQQEDAAATADDPTFKCIARYLADVPQANGVLLVHINHPDADRYAAAAGAVRSTSLTIVHPRVSIKNRAFEQPYRLLMLLLATPQEANDHSALLHHVTYHHRNTRLLVVVAAPPAPASVPSSPDLQPIFAVANEKYLLNVAVLRVAAGGNDTRVYVHYPYGGGACGRRTTPQVLGECERLPHLHQLYPDKVPRQFNGCPVKFWINGITPAVIDAASMSERALVAGCQVALVNIIARRLNMTANKVPAYYKCQHEYVYYMDAVRWYVPVAPPRPQWQNVVLLFQAPLWLAITACFVFNVLVWWTAGAGGFVHCLLGSLVTLLNGAVPLPRRLHRRFVVTAWTLCSLVLIAAYQSQLLSRLLTPVPGEQPITTERELLASDTPVDVAFIYIMYSTETWRNLLLAHMNRTGSFRKPLSSSEPRALLLRDLTTRYLASNYTDARGQPTLVPFADVFRYKPQCLRLEEKSATLPVLDLLTARVVEAGILAKFLRDVDFSRYWTTAAAHQDEPLSLDHLGFTFIVLLLGSALALLTFVVEVVHWRVLYTRLRSYWRTAVTAVQRRWRRASQRWRGTFHRRVLARIDHH